MRMIFLATAASIALLFPAGSRAEEARLTILHTTDLHGALTSHDYVTDRPARRGLTKLAPMIAAARAETSATLLLDAGDCIQGSPLTTFYRRAGATLPEPMMAAMSRLGYDAMAVGNHEFSFGMAELEKARTAAKFPWLAANVERLDGQPAFERSLIKKVGPFKVGIIGVCTPAVPMLEDSSRWQGLRFREPIEPARREAKRLREAEHCDAVVILAHTGLEDADRGATPASTHVNADENWGRRLATDVDGVDLVILGHTHTVIASREVDGTLVTQAGKWGEGLGRVDLLFSRADGKAPWKLGSRTARYLAVEDDALEDTTLTALAEPYDRAARAALAERIATATTELSAPAGRFGDGALWDLVHRVQLEASGADVSLAALDAPGMRIAPGPILVRDVYQLLPYENTLVAVEMTGAELEETLENGARQLATYDFSARALADPGAQLHRFDSAEGVRYAVDLTRPPGDRIVNLEFQGAPLARDRRLKVVVNSYRAGGAGGFEHLRRAPRVWTSSQDLRDLVIDHLRRRGSVAGENTGNWTLLPDYAATPERPLIDLLVRRGALDRERVKRLEPFRPTRRGDLATWLTRAFDWKGRMSGAFVDVPDSLAPFFDALLQRKVLGETADGDRARPESVVRLPVALEWCERAARNVKMAVGPAPDRAFRRGLLAGVTGPRGEWPARHAPDTLSRAQALAIVANVRYPTLRILETTDFHGAILSTARDRATRRTVGGSAVLAAHLERLRSANPEGTVLLDGGDCFQGTMISNLQFGRPVVEQMNYLGYAAAAIGNHEFDWSADTLQRRIREMKFADLGANMREKKTKKMPRWVRADTSVQRRGVRVGVLGLCYRFTPSVTLAEHVAHLYFEDDSVTSAREVPRLRAKSDVVIAVGHVPAESDTARRAVRGDLVRLARGVPGVDLWLGGHSHNQVIDRVGEVPVMIAGSHGQVIAVCDMVVDPLAHKVLETRTELQPTFVDEVTPDSAVAAMVQRWNAGVAATASVPVGRNAHALTRNRGGESAIGSLVADAIRAAAGSDIAMQNSGGLRADLPAGPVTKASIYEVMPFENVVYTMELSGADVKRALEDALRFGRVTQVSGIRYAFDNSRAAGDRVTSVTDADGQALDPARFYKVAVNDFMATGGDNYDALSGGRNRTNTGIPVRDVLERFVAQRSKDGATLDYDTDGRIRRVQSGEGQ
jgi:2',3'-cyclic-nucleotide 2'-phosphodiesterase/3'-nucleotidase